MTVYAINAQRPSYPTGAQQLGATVAGSAATGRSGGAKSTDVYQQLENYVKMTPAQRMREDLLKKLGLTEQELAAKTPDEQKAVETKLSELIQQQMQQAQAAHQNGGSKIGQFLDVVA